MTAFGRRVVLGLPLLAAATPRRSIRIGALRFGSLHWELDVMRAHGLDAEGGLAAEITELDSAPAGQLALQAGRVDVVLLDWLWVSRQRSAGADWSYIPTSCALGAVIGAPNSPVRRLSDLPGHRLGVAGSPLDKSWLLLRTYALRHIGLNLETQAQLAFAAPPLLAEQLVAGRLDAVLTFWPFAARAQAAGMRIVVGMDEVVSSLGAGPGVPFTGFVFSDAWARDNQEALDAFVLASRRARTILAESDAEWDRIAPLTQADAAERPLLAAAYRAGVPWVWDEPQRLGCARLVEVVAETSGRALIGNKARISPGTFWPISWSDRL